MKSDLGYDPQNLKYIRKGLKLTQAEFACLMGIAQGTYSKIEAGKLELSVPQLIKVCEKADLSLDVIVSPETCFPELGYLQGPTYR